MVHRFADTSCTHISCGFCSLLTRTGTSQLSLCCIKLPFGSSLKALGAQQCALSVLLRVDLLAFRNRKTLSAGSVCRQFVVSSLKQSSEAQ